MGVDTPMERQLQEDREMLYSLHQNMSALGIILHEVKEKLTEKGDIEIDICLLDGISSPVVLNYLHKSFPVDSNRSNKEEISEEKGEKEVKEIHPVVSRKSKKMITVDKDTTVSNVSVGCSGEDVSCDCKKNSVTVGSESNTVVKNLNPVPSTNEEDDFEPIMLRDLKKKKGGRIDVVGVGVESNTVVENLNTVCSPKEVVENSGGLPLRDGLFVNIPPPGPFTDDLNTKGAIPKTVAETIPKKVQDIAVKPSLPRYSTSFRKGPSEITINNITVRTEDIPPIVKAKIDFPLPIPVIPLNASIKWELPRFRKQLCENGEVARYQMGMGSTIFDIDPVYVSETIDPTTGKLNLKVRGCFLCFSLRHNKKAHQTVLDPSLRVVIEIYVCYVCGRLGYHTDNCVSPGCFDNKSRPKLFRRI